MDQCITREITISHKGNLEEIEILMSFLNYLYFHGVGSLSEFNRGNKKKVVIRDLKFDA